jgi:hypothetical protein
MAVCPDANQQAPSKSAAAAAAALPSLLMLLLLFCSIYSAPAEACARRLS